MKSDERICSDFTQRVTSFFDSTEDWRRESAICWEFYDHHPTEQQGFDTLDNGHTGKLNQRQIPNPSKKVAANAPVVTAYINAVVGLLLRDQKRIVAYSVDDGEDAEESGLNKGFRYFDSVTHRPDVKTEQTTAASVQGVGATVTYLDFTIDNAIAGQPVYEEKEMVFFDRSMGGKLQSDQLGWCGYAEPMYRDNLDEYVDKCREDKDFIGRACASSFGDKLFEWKSYEDESDIDFLYVYYWREYRKVWDVENPFLVIPDFLIMLTEEHPEAANVFADAAKELQIDFKQSHFTFDSDSYKKFESLIKNIEFMTGQDVPEIESSSRMGRAYYKAEFAKGMLLKTSPSFTTQCHAMSFVTAYYDRTYGYHYGLMRPLAYYQKMLNSTLSDMMTYSKRSSSGGNVAVKGAADTIAVIKEALENGNQVIPALPDMDVSNVGTPDAGAAMLSTTEMILKLMPMSLGMPPELFGMLSTGDMTSALMGKIKQQMTATLSHLANGFDRSSLCDGWIMRDLMLEMAQGITGKLELNFILGSEEGVFELSRKDLARNYTIQLVERDATRDEQLESFEKLLEIMKLLPPEQMAQAAPLLIEAAPLYLDKKKELIEAITPKPNPAADEQAAKQSEANLRLMNAQSLQLENQAKLESARGDVAGQEAQLKLKSEEADIMETMSKVQKNAADVKKSGVEVSKAQLDAIMSLINQSGESNNGTGRENRN
jgi:hypothetical protein